MHVRRRRPPLRRLVHGLGAGMIVAGTIARVSLPLTTAGAVEWGAPACRSEPFRPGWTDLVNCSEVPAPAISAVLESTDARRFGLVNPRDRFLANRQWLVWIDTTGSPGTMRGLWPLTSAGAFAGMVDPGVPGGVFKSLIAVNAGFGLPNPNPVRGYRGTHVEIWRTPGTWYYTYRRGPPAVSDIPPVEPGRSVSRYTNQLVDARNGSTHVEGLNGVGATMTWSIAYTIEPDGLHVGTEVAASNDIHLSGDLGGLLLLTNTACSVPANFGDCGDLAAVSARSLHHVGLPAADDLLWNRAIGPDTDQFQQARSSPVTWELRADDPTHNLVMSPSWSLAGPAEQAYAPKSAFHYNSRPMDVGGINGFGSLDVVIEAPPGGTVALGPSFGVARFGATLSHRLALAEAAARARAAQPGVSDAVAGVVVDAVGRWFSVLE